MLRQGRRMRSPLRSITTPQHSPGYSATAWDRTRAYSSEVRIIEDGSATGAIRFASGEDRPAGREGQSTSREGRPAPRQGRPAPRQGRPAPRQGRNDRDLVAVLQQRLQTLEGFDGFTVHVEVHVMMDLARLVAHQPLEAAEPALELVEQAAHVARLHGDAVLVVRGPAKGRGDIDVDAHGLSFSRATR